MVSGWFSLHTTPSDQILRWVITRSLRQRLGSKSPGSHTSLPQPQGIQAVSMEHEPHQKRGGDGRIKEDRCKGGGDCQRERERERERMKDG